MNYIIDGHNLIAHIPGLDLGMIDDEDRLIAYLLRFGEQTGDKSHSGRAGRPRSVQAGKLEVYFDKAPAGQAGLHNYGRVRAYFVREGSTADEAIRKRLDKLGKQARNWVVVTSDRSVQAAAREMHAGVVSSEEFSRQLVASQQPGLEKSNNSDQPLSPAEVDEWLMLFKQRKSTK